LTVLPRRLGKYHVLEQIAQGGMAEIYRAKTVGIAGFEKILALKRISPHFAREPRFIRSFVDEARIAVTLNHRNIVQVFDFGKADGDLYLAMELIEGVDLRSALAAASEVGVPLPPSVACYILGDLASGLDYAHRKADGAGRPLAIVHCDVSPQNVMLSFEGFVKILDFGVARARFANPPREKRLRGKPRYMAPEQTRGEAPTAATDVFALGILAWELLTGLPLFEGDDLAEILRAVRRADAPPVSRLNPEVPEVLSQAIARALSPQPALRGDAGELALALSRTARELTHVPSSRAIADWLAHIYAGEQEAFTRDTLGGGGFGVERAPTATGMGSDPWAAAEEPTGLGPGGLWNPGTGTGTAVSPSITDMPDSDDEPLDGGKVEPVAAAAPETGPALVENRRVVATAVIVDGGHPDRQRELLRILAELVYKHGALLHSQTSEGLVAVFGLEVAGEDDIAGAMQFSLDAIELAAEATDGALSTCCPQMRLATRAGIAAQKSGGSVRVRGDAVEEARLLARGAEPGRPLLTGGTGRVASAQFTFRELPPRRLRSRRLRVLELIGPRDFAEQTRSLHERRGRFVGRSAELERLAGALERALTSSRREVVALVGGTGMGKSRLVAEFVARVEARPHAPALVAVAASPAARDAPYGFIGDFLQTALGLPLRRGKAGRGATIRRLRHVLTRRGAEPAEVDECLAAIELSLELRDGAIGTAGQVSADLRDRVSSAMRSVGRALGVGAALLVLEDLHLADLPSVDVLRASAPIQPGVPELVLFTSRDRERLPVPASAEIIDLDELGEAERRELILDRLAEAASPDTVATVARRGGGNPLFIEELSSAVRQLGRGAQLPAGLRDVLMARVDLLPVASKATLQHAAVVGPVFRSRILEELLGPAVHQHLQELVEEGLVVSTRGEAAEVDEGELAFRHGLLQEAVYDSLGAAARRQSHARLGRLLAARVEAGREEPPLLVARHLELGGETELAAAMWLRAGQVALAAYDAAEARNAFSRVLELDARADESEPAVRARRVGALLGREQTSRDMGEHEAQMRDLAELERLAADDPVLEADVGNRRATALLRLGDFPGAAEAARTAERAALATDNQRCQGEALRLQGEAYERTGQFQRGLEVVGQAVEIFQRLGASYEEMQARIGIGRIHLTRSRYEEAQETYKPILERLEETADPWLERVVRKHVAVIQLCMGEFEPAMKSALRAVELCEFFGDRARAGESLSVCGMILTEVGQYGPARDRYQRALAVLDRTGSRWGRADCLVHAGGNECYLGELGRGLELLEESVAIAREIGARYVEANAEVALCGALLRRGARGDVERALSTAARALATARGATLMGAEIAALTRRGEALRRLGRLDQALASSGRAVELLEAQRHFEGSEEEVLFVHHQILQAIGDPAAADLLTRARDGVERKLGRMEDPDWRRSFVDAIALHRLILGPEPDTAPS
jgi:tetratricopeptide (TPR) repeat protein